MITVYGISNCDTVKRARAWLQERGIEHRFHDFKKAGVPPECLQAWMMACGWETLLNRKGSTWRQLDAQTQARVNSGSGAIALMCTHTSVIKRPVVEWPSGAITVGFDAAAWAAHSAGA